MAYDEDLAGRIRALVDAQSTADGFVVTERKMFGGLAFLVGGHMAVAASQDGLMIRTDLDATADLLARTDAEPMVMRGRPMRGWLRVAAEHIGDDARLRTWVTIGTSYAASLPPKTP